MLLTSLKYGLRIEILAVPVEEALTQIRFSTATKLAQHDTSCFGENELVRLPAMRITTVLFKRTTENSEGLEEEESIEE